MSRSECRRLVISCSSFISGCKSTTKSLVFQTQTDFKALIIPIRSLQWKGRCNFKVLLPSTFGWQLPQIVAGFVAGKKRKSKGNESHLPGEASELLVYVRSMYIVQCSVAQGQHSRTTVALLLRRFFASSSFDSTSCCLWYRGRERTLALNKATRVLFFVSKNYFQILYFLGSATKCCLSW